MYRYKYDKSYHHRSRKAHRRVVLAVFVSTIVVGIMGYIGYDIINQYLNKQAPVSRSNLSSVQGDSVNLFTTPYFQFQADDSWKEVISEQKDGHYVFRSYKNTLVVRDVTFDVNKKDAVAIPLVRTTHLYPVTVDPSGNLIPQGGAGDHCNTLMPKNSPKVPTLVKQRQVSFVCTPDAILYQAIVGVIGGGTSIQIPRPNGGSANYTITYRDLTITPTDAPLKGIVSSFQSR